MSMNSVRISLGKLSVTKALNSTKFLQKQRGNVIILHGTCDTGSGMKNWLKNISKTEFAFPNLKILYPSAPIQKYTLLNGQKSSVWFDRISSDPYMPEDKTSIDLTANELSQFIQNESNKSGISLTKTVIGGFSTGGIMALHMGYRFHPEVAGIFTLASFLPPDSHVFKDLSRHSLYQMNKGDSVMDIAPAQDSVTPGIDQVYKSIHSTAQSRKFPKLFMSQGIKDPLVEYRWGKETFNTLQNCGVEGHFYTVPNSGHEIRKSQLSLLHRWIENVLSDEPHSKNFPNETRKHHINDESSIPALK